MDCHSIINNNGIIIRCTNDFTTCTGITIDDNIFDQIDIPTEITDSSNDFINYIGGIVIGAEVNNGTRFPMVTPDGWKYAVFVTYDNSLADIKVSIPYPHVKRRIGGHTNQLILQSHLCLNHHVNHIKVLMVDDSVVTCKIAKRLIESTGSICDTMTDVRNFVGFDKKLLTNYYNIILVDINMPNINGYQLSKVLRSFLPGNVLLIGTSTDTSDECSKKCIRSGFSWFLPKPYDIDNIVDTLYMYKAMTANL